MAPPLPAKLRRLELGLTLLDVAVRMRKPRPGPGRLSMIERGLIVPRDDEARRIAAVLESNPSALFPTTSDAATVPAE
jgi:transcriptional regulator with XRE-family HTH domain